MSDCNARRILEKNFHWNPYPTHLGGLHGSISRRKSSTRRHWFLSSKVHCCMSGQVNLQYNFVMPLMESTVHIFVNSNKHAVTGENYFEPAFHERAFEHWWFWQDGFITHTAQVAITVWGGIAWIPWPNALWDYFETEVFERRPRNLVDLKGATKLSGYFKRCLRESISASLFTCRSVRDDHYRSHIFSKTN